MSLYKRGRIWWYKFVWSGEQIRESTKQSNRRVAEQMEAAHKTSLAKGEVGIRKKEKAPTLAKFMEDDFLPYVRSTKAAKPNTVRFYENSVTNLKGYPKLAGVPLDEIRAEHITGFIANRQLAEVQVSTVNRDLATLRRVFSLAMEWGKVSTILPRVRMLAGENRRERVLTAAEEAKYLEAATALGNELTEDYKRALDGIRAVKRGQQPRQPDAYLLRDVVTILIDCGLRPEECFRLRWQDNIRDGGVEIHAGKGKGSRRRVPASARVLGILEMRRTVSTSEWVFPAETRSGHIEGSSLKKQHATAVKLSGIDPFVLYSLRHTAITRWAKHMDAFVLQRIAGHTDLKTTRFYVHPNEDDVVEAMAKVWSGHKSGHTAKTQPENQNSESPAIN